MGQDGLTAQEGSGQVSGVSAVVKMMCKGSKERWVRLSPEVLQAVGITWATGTVYRHGGGV